MNRRFVGLCPRHIAAVGREPIPHVENVGLALLDGADGGEGLQPVLAAEHDCRRIVDDAIAGLDPLQRRRLAVADLHEAFAPATPHMLGRGDRDPMPGHCQYPLVTGQARTTRGPDRAKRSPDKPSNTMAKERHKPVRFATH
jgi:hypothetical protein